MVGSPSGSVVIGLTYVPASLLVHQLQPLLVPWRGADIEFVLDQRLGIWQRVE